MKVRLLIGALLVLGSVLLGLLLLWAHQGREAEARIHQAEAHLRAGRFQDALSLVENVLGGAVSERALRIRVDALSALESPFELSAAEALWDFSLSRESLVRLVQAAMRWDAPAIARHALDVERRNSLLAPMDRYALEATVAVRWGEYATAAAAFDRAMALGYPENDQSRLTAGILRIQEGDLAGGIERLEAISRDSPHFAEAVRSLMTIYRQTDRLEDVAAHAPHFFRSASIAVVEKLALLDYLHAKGSSALLYEALEWTWRSARTGAAVADLLVWCYLDGRAAAWADARLASLPHAAFEVLPLRLIAVARDRQLRLAEHRNDAAPVERDSGRFAFLREDLSAFTSTSAYAALLQSALLEEEEAAANLVRRQVLMRELHLGLLGGDPELVARIDLFARTFEMTPVWEVALVRLSREHSAAADSAIQILYRLYSEQKDTRALFQVMERAVERNPDSVVALNNLTHLGLLLGENLPRFHRLAEQLSAYQLRDVRIASTCAFSKLLQGEAEAARAILEEHAPDVLRQPPVALYYAATVAVTEDLERAEAWIASIDPATLFPEEAELLKKLTPARKD